jgi:cobalt-zinc-cadmium resistance protein CzcA
VDKTNAQIKTALSLEKTNVYYSYDENNLALNNLPLSVFGVSQSVLFPTVYGAQKRFFTSEYEKEKAKNELLKNKLIVEVSKTYHQIVYWQHQERLYQFLDSLYQNFSKASDRRFELGETNYLEKITAEAKFRQIKTKLIQIEREKSIAYELLQSIVQSDQPMVISANSIEPLRLLENKSNRGLYSDYYEKIKQSYASNVSLQKQNWLPDLNVEYFQGTNSGISQPLYGIQLGVSIPLVFSGNMAKSKVAQLELESWEQQRQNQELKMDAFVNQKQNELAKFEEAINYYTNYGKNLSSEITKVAESSYKNGEIDFFQYIISLENATTIQVDYLEAVLNYNLTQ